jgi:hypothetical protein
MARTNITHLNGGVINGQEYVAENVMFTELYSKVRSVTVAIAAGTTNTVTATISVLNEAGAAVSGIHMLNVWISAAADGGAITTTSASGALTATTGAIVTAVTAKKHVLATTSATGVLVLSLVDSGKTQGERFCVADPNSGQIVVSAATVTASYG